MLWIVHQGKKYESNVKNAQKSVKLFPYLLKPALVEEPILQFAAVNCRWAANLRTADCTERGGAKKRSVKTANARCGGK